MRMRLVALYFEILIFVGVDRAGHALDPKPRKRARLASQLKPRLVEMVGIEMAVATGPHERSRLQPALLCEHVGQERIGCDVERHAQEDVGASLVELEVKLPARHLG